MYKRSYMFFGKAGPRSRVFEQGSFGQQKDKAFVGEGLYWMVLIYVGRIYQHGPS